jgi:hypothetical protein
MKQYYSSSITRLVWVIVVLVTFLSGTSIAQRARRADSIKTSFIGSYISFDQWVPDPTKQKFGTLKEIIDSGFRYVAIPTDLGLNNEVRNFWDLDPKPYGGAPIAAPKNMVLGGSADSLDDVLIIQPMSLFTAFDNAYYIRFEFERHVPGADSSEYPGFLKHSGLIDSLTGTDVTDSGTSPAFLVGSARATSNKAVRLRVGVNNHGVFADSMWHNGIFDGAPDGGRANGNHEYFAENASGRHFNRRMLMRMRVKIDQTISGTPTLCIVKRIEATNKGEIRTTHFDTIKVTTALFKNINTGFDTIDIRYVRDAAHFNLDKNLSTDGAQFTYFSFDWPGQVNATFDYLELMTAHINVGDDSAGHDGFIDNANIDSNSTNSLVGAYSGEDFLAPNPVELNKLISKIKQDYLGHVNYIRIGDEFPSMHGLPFKRLVKLMRDSTKGKIEVVPFTVDSGGWMGHSFPDPHVFNFEGARKGWVDTSLYGDPKLILFDPYCIAGFALPKRTTSTDLAAWELEHVPNLASGIQNDSFVVPSAFHYTPENYLKGCQFNQYPWTETGYMMNLHANRREHRWTERQNAGISPTETLTRYGNVWQAGQTPFIKTNTYSTHQSWLSYGGGRPPTGAEMKMTGHLATSCGATGLILYLLTGPGPAIDGSANNGGIMANDGTYSGNYETLTVDTLSNEFWLGFQERHDTIKKLLPLLIKYGSTLLHSKYLGDWTAAELPNIPSALRDSLPFRFNSLVTLNDDLHHDTLRKNDSITNAYDTSNRMFVHISLWVDTLDHHSDTMLYITNMRTDDSYDTAEVPSTIDRRFITLQMNREHIVLDMRDTLGAQLDSGKIWTPFVGRQSTDSLKVWLYAGDGILVKLLDTLQGHMAPMRIAIDYPKGGGDFNDHGRIQFDQAVPGVLDKSNSAKWTIPSTSKPYTVGISDTTTVKMWQDSMLYHTIHSSRPTQLWRNQNWTEQTTPTPTITFNFKKQINPLPPGINQRNPHSSIDSITHYVTIKTDLEDHGNTGQVRFFDPWLVDSTTLRNFNTITDTLSKTSPFLPKEPAVPFNGKNPEHYGGIFLKQDIFRDSSTPNYSLNAFSAITSDSLKGKDSLANTGDWVFIMWHLDDTLSHSDPTPPQIPSDLLTENGYISFSRQYDPIFMKDSAHYIARYKRHMMTYDDTLGFAFNGQRKLAYSFNDSLGNNHYNIVYASTNRVFAASGYKHGGKTYYTDNIKWNNETLISGWNHVAWDDTLGYGYDYGFPALGLHRPWTEPISHIVYEQSLRTGTDRYVRISKDSTGKMPSFDDYLNSEPYLSVGSKLTMPVIAPGDNPIGSLDVVAWVADTGIMVEAISCLGDTTGIMLTSEQRTDKLHHEPLRFGNITANHPTIWMDSCRVCGTDSSVHHVWLAWQQDTTIMFSFRPHKTGPNPAGPLALPIDLPVTDIFCVEFDIKVGPEITFENVGTPMDVSYTTQNFTYDNRNPCISGARYWTGGTDSSLVRIAYESWADFGGPYQGITVAHKRTGSGWKTTSVLATSDTITNLYHNPSIEVSRFHRSIPVPNYYSLAFDCGNHTAIQHWAMDSATNWLSYHVLDFSCQLPQLSVDHSKIDTNMLRMSLNIGSSPLALQGLNFGLFKYNGNDSLWGYHTVIETDSSGTLSITHGLGEPAIDDGTTKRELELVVRDENETIDSVHAEDYFTQTENFTLPANGTFSYYRWLAANNDSIFTANFDSIIFALDFYDTSGAFICRLDSEMLTDSMLRIAGATRTVSYSRDSSSYGYIRYKRLSPGLLSSEGKWQPIITTKRLSSANSNKRSNRTLDLASDNLAFTVYPNPTRGDVTVGFTLPKEGDVSVDVINQLGAKVGALVPIKRLGNGRHNYVWHPTGLPAGIYTFILHFGNSDHVVRVAYIE